jgi:hypothetical protein
MSHFISRSGTRHVIGPAVSQMQGGRIVALCGFSQLPDDEETPAEAIQLCGWCAEAEERARRIARDALEAAGEPGKVLLWPARDPDLLP